MTPETIVADLQAVDLSACTLHELGQLVRLIETSWPLGALAALNKRHRLVILETLDRYDTEPTYQPPEQPAPVDPVLEALAVIDMSRFTPGHVDRIAATLFRFGSVETWRNFAALDDPNTPNGVRSQIVETTPKATRTMNRTRDTQ